MQFFIKNHETWLICGGRHFSDQDMFDEVMARLAWKWGCPERIVHGACPTGADQMADAWGKRLAIDVVAVPADWKKHGRAAGPLRNEDMLVKHKPRRVIAFPGGRGTTDMVQRAKSRLGPGVAWEIDVIEVQTVFKDPA